VLLVRHPGFDPYDVEMRTQAVIAAALAVHARHSIFPDTLVGGGIGRRIAARWQDRAATSVVAVGDGAVVCRQDGGRSDVTRPMPRILVLAPQVFAEPVEECLREARLVDVAMPDAQPSQLRPMGNLKADPATIALTEAELILSAGDGVTDWEAFHQLAAALGAAEGGSRVVCDAGYLPRSRQIGASGVLVEPKCYLAFGIAGASQHLQGIAGCERVVAVNTDIHAEMIKRADLSIIADAQAVMPALVRQLTGH
jgi:electron transfer flavoprotein alpha subunit